MFNSPILDFSISLIFLFLLFSLLVSWVMEAYASYTNRKGKFLKKMIRKMLGGNDKVNWTARLYYHPSVESLSFKHKRITSMIPEDIFADVLCDLVVEYERDYEFIQSDDGSVIYVEDKKGDDKKDDKQANDQGKNPYYEDLKKALLKMPEGDLKQTLKMYHDQLDKDELPNFKSAIKAWYKEYQQRINHAYTRRIKYPLFAIGFVIALMFNIDLFHISTRLWTDSNLRDSVVTAAMDFTEKHDSLEKITIDTAFFEHYKNSLDLPIGWGEQLKKHPELAEKYYEANFFKRVKFICCGLHKDRANSSLFWLILVKIAGFAGSGFVVTFGSSFWFDLLRKVISFKKTVKEKQ